MASWACKALIELCLPEQMSMRGLEKKALASLFVAALRGHNMTLTELANELGLSEQECRGLLDALVREGLINARGIGGEEKAYELTEKGRRAIKVVMTGGVFDILHIGHLATLRAAKELGDVLVVVVARDSTVERLKKRRPLNPETHRLELVSALRPVDAAILGGLGDPYETVELVGPDIIALGYDQKHDEDEIRAELEKRGLNVDVIRLDVEVPEVKSSKILMKLLNEL